MRSTDEELEENEKTLARYQNTLQKQKEENKDLHTRTDSLVQLQDDFTRSDIL